MLRCFDVGNVTCRRKCGIVAVKVSISQFLSNALDLKGGGYCLLIRGDVHKVARGSCPPPNGCMIVHN